MSNDAQRKSVRQGLAFHNSAQIAVEDAGFEIIERKFIDPELKIEIDCIANNRHGLAFAFEFKGSSQGDLPGLWKTDSVKKAFAIAYYWSTTEAGSGMAPMIVITSHMPTKGAALNMIRRTPREIVLDWLSVGDRDDLKKLTTYAAMTEADIKRIIIGGQQAIEIQKRRNGYYDCLKQPQLL